jgi:hypothetical protein
VQAIRRFAVRVAIFLGMQGVVAAAVFLPFMRHIPDTYMAYLDVKQRRLETVPSPRLILVGSSNLAFSFDSMRAREQLKLDVVNMGIHQGLGLDFVLNETVKNIRAGDVVLVSPEYLHFLGDSTTDTIVETLIASPRATVAGTDFAIFKKMMDQSLALLGRRTRTLVLIALGRAPFSPQQPYRSNSFNEFGDVVAHRTMEPMPNRRRGEPCNFQSKRVYYVIDRLNTFAEQCRQRGATVFFSHPPYPKSEFARDSSSLEKLNEKLVEELSFPVISVPEETVYPDEWFYDTEYHTLPPGTERRTELVINRLNGRLKDKPPIAVGSRR